MMDISMDLLQWFKVIFRKILTWWYIRKQILQNGKLAKRLTYKQFIRKLEKKQKVGTSFMDNIWGTDLADMQLLNKFNKRIRFFLCVINIYNKYAYIIPLKDKNVITITNAFQKMLDESGWKPNKIPVDKGSELCHRSMRPWRERNGIEMYSTRNEENLLLLKDLLES